LSPRAFFSGGYGQHREMEEFFALAVTGGTGFNGLTLIGRIFTIFMDKLLPLSYFYVLHTTMKSMCFLGVFSMQKQTLVQKAGEIFM